MAELDVALDALAMQIGEWLAPYQPNIPMLFPNPAPTAGQIPATLIAYGRPIQTHVMKRLENKLAQVAVFDTDKGGVFPFLNRGPSKINYTTPGGEGVPASGVEYLEIGREKKQVVVQVWAYSKESRQPIAKLIRSCMTDAFRQTQVDGTIALYKYQAQKSMDFEQVDSIYVRNFQYEVDITDVAEVPVTEVITTEVGVTQGVPTTVNLRSDQL